MVILPISFPGFDRFEDYMLAIVPSMEPAWGQLRPSRMPALSDGSPRAGSHTTRIATTVALLAGTVYSSPDREVTNEGVTFTQTRPDGRRLS